MRDNRHNGDENLGENRGPVPIFVCPHICLSDLGIQDPGFSVHSWGHGGNFGYCVLHSPASFRILNHVPLPLSAIDDGASATDCRP